MRISHRVLSALRLGTVIGLAMVGTLFFRVFWPATHIGGAITSALWLSLMVVINAELQAALLRIFRVPASHDVLTAIVRAESLTDTRCPSVIVVGGPFGAAPTCELRWRLGSRSVLFLSTALTERLDSDELAALLVHELAHVRLRHLDARIRLNLLLIICAATPTFVPRLLGLQSQQHGAVIVSIGVVVAAMMIGYMFVSQRLFDGQELQADLLAVRVLGLTRVVRALEKASAGGHGRSVSTDSSLLLYLSVPPMSCRLERLRRSVPAESLG
jgi:Zn-dependent protease with chaperone function